MRVARLSIEHAAPAEIPALHPLERALHRAIKQDLGSGLSPQRLQGGAFARDAGGDLGRRFDVFRFDFQARRWILARLDNNRHSIQTYNTDLRPRRDRRTAPRLPVFPGELRYQLKPESLRSVFRVTVIQIDQSLMEYLIELVIQPLLPVGLCKEGVIKK